MYDVYLLRAARVWTAPVASLFILVVFAGLSVRVGQASQKRPARLSSARKVTRARPPAKSSRATKSSQCGSCANPFKRATRKIAKRSQKPPCHPAGYLDPAVARRFSAAVAEMRRSGIVPRITSAWRSSAHQASLHRCSLSSRCRRANGVYGALPSGNSLHEAGFAVDIGGIATGRRGARRLSRRGYTIVRIMRKHGFRWPYGMSDPVHFEADPREHGYRNVRQAIVRNQTRCRPAVVLKASSKAKKPRTNVARTSSGFATARIN